MHGEPHGDGDELRNLLNQRAKTTIDQAIQAGGQVNREQLVALKQLAQLMEIRSAARVPSTRPLWPTVAVFGLTLAVVSVLFFARVPETEIELDVSVSQLGFRLAQHQILTEVLKLTSLGVSGLAEIQLPRAGSRGSRTIRQDDGSGSAIRLSAVDGRRKGELTLDALNLPAATQVWLRPTELPQQWRLSLRGADMTLRAAVDGPVAVGLPDAPPESVDFPSPESVVMQPGPNDVDLDMEFPAGSKGVFPPQEVAEALSFSRIDEHLDTERTAVRRVSTILSGTLYFESLDGRERRLRPGEGIRFQSSQGEISTLELHDGHIALTFHGHVRGITTGTEESRRSLMPTYLDWLSAQHALSLLWGTMLYAFGLIIGALRWWGVLA